MATKREAERRPDNMVRQELYDLIEHADDVDMSQAEALVSDGLVVLLGSVPDYETKRRIEGICRKVKGVHEVHDQLLVLNVNADAEPAGFHTEPPRAGFRGPGS
jgi:osmotically-inducible protein OsmY